jgi:hypothetical protein
LRFRHTRLRHTRFRHTAGPAYPLLIVCHFSGRSHPSPGQS